MAEEDVSDLERFSSERISASHLRVMTGKFWMVQSDLVRPVDHNDFFGRPRVLHPARSIFSSKMEAVTAARRLSARKPGRHFFVLEAVGEYSTIGMPDVREDVL